MRGNLRDLTKRTFAVWDGSVAPGGMRRFTLGTLDVIRLTRRGATIRDAVRRLAACMALVFAAVRPVVGQTSLLLADDSTRPRISVSWPTADGKTVSLQGERPYRSPSDKSLLGKNVECYAGLGGTRLDKGLADGQGAVFRVGLYKADTAKPFFENIAENAMVTIRVERVVMNQPAVPRPKTGLIHLRYTLSDLTTCGLTADARNLFLTVDPEDPVKKGVQADSGRFGSLDGGEGHGSLAAKVEPDGSVSFEVKFPYEMLRHLKDPYQRTRPGAFFEPPHFHFEMELLPPAVAAERDAGRKPEEPRIEGELPDDPGDAKRGGS